MTATYRIYEINDNGSRTVVGWGDHMSMAEAKATVEKWGKVLAWELDADHDAADALILPHAAPQSMGAIQIAVEPLRDGTSWPTC